MAIDFNQSRKKNFDRNKWYSRQYVNNMKLEQNATSNGVFYSTDKVAQQSQTIAVGNIKKTVFTLTIETTDTIDGMKVDDYVLYNGDLWLVESIVADDYNSAKEFSKRAGFITEIRLRK